MPELPEVETIKNQISDYLPLKILKVRKGTFYKKILRTKDCKLEQLTIKQITRHGKYLLIDLGHTYMIVHLGMSGRLQIHEQELNIKHNHYTLYCDKILLSYIDPRRFGFLKFIKKENYNSSLLNIGPDVKSEEFTIKYLQDSIARYPERKLKITLLDQKLFAGIGNYLASEICAHAKISPLRQCKKINKKEEIKNLFIAIQKSIDQSIKTQGTTFSGGYLDAHGEKGKGVQNLIVFHQKYCQQCLTTKIKSIILAGRNTFYCPKCQK